MSDDIEDRVRQLEKTLESFFDALATNEATPAADATEEAVNGQSAAVSVEERLRRLEKQTLRLQLEVGALGAPGEPWNPDATYPAAETPESTQTKAVHSLGVSVPALRIKALERLAGRLLAERDRDVLQWRDASAGVWDILGRLVGVGDTPEAALRDAVDSHGRDFLMATLPGRTELSGSAPQPGDDEAELAQVLHQLLDQYREREPLTPGTVRAMIDEALRKVQRR